MNTSHQDARKSTVNKIILAGRVATDPSYRVKDGETIFSFCVLTKEDIKRNGQNETIEELHYIKANESVPNIEIIEKQMSVYVQGYLNTVQFTDRNGIRRYKTFVTSTTLDVLNF